MRAFRQCCYAIFAMLSILCCLCHLYNAAYSLLSLQYYLFVISDREHSRATCVGSVAGRSAACSVALLAACSVALLREAEVICAWDLLGTGS